MVCSLWVPCLPLLGFPGSLGALVHCLASSRERKAPTEPVIFTLFCWSGLLSWCRSGSTCGYYNCSLFLWPVTHTQTYKQICAHFQLLLVSRILLMCMLAHWSSVGSEEAGGPVWYEELCREDSYFVVDGAREVWTWAWRGTAPWTNQRPGSVPPTYRH